MASLAIPQQSLMRRTRSTARPAPRHPSQPRPLPGRRPRRFTVEPTDLMARRSNAISRVRIAVGTIPSADRGKKSESARSTGVTSAVEKNLAPSGANTTVRVATRPAAPNEIQNAVSRWFAVTSDAGSAPCQGLASQRRRAVRCICSRARPTRSRPASAAEPSRQTQRNSAGPDKCDQVPTTSLHRRPLPGASPLVSWAAWFRRGLHIRLPSVSASTAFDD